jgi:hypothetical protein
LTGGSGAYKQGQKEGEEEEEKGEIFRAYNWLQVFNHSLWGYSHRER